MAICTHVVRKLRIAVKLMHAVRQTISLSSTMHEIEGTIKHTQIYVQIFFGQAAASSSELPDLSKQAKTLKLPASLYLECGRQTACGARPPILDRSHSW